MGRCLVCSDPCLCVVYDYLQQVSAIRNRAILQVHAIHVEVEKLRIIIGVVGRYLWALNVLKYGPE